ncbi:MAG: DUF6162 family protein [Thermoanaerobaculia bacterium]
MQAPLRVVRDHSGAASLGSMDAPGRTVRPPSAAREAAGVGAALAIVLLAGALRVLTLDRSGASAASPATSVLAGADQTIFQALLVSVDSIADLKRRTGAWPEISALAADETPPFAPALLPAEARGLDWKRRAEGASADYTGLDPGGRRTAFLLRVSERRTAGLDQGMPTRAARAGPRLAAEVWILKGGKALPGLFPATNGWYQLVALDGEAGTGARR